MKRLGSNFYDKEYFEGASKSNYGKLNPDGGYTEKIYFPVKCGQIADILDFAGYTTVWKPKNCLVVGCAIGYLVMAMQIDGAIEAHGIDISEYAIERGKKEGIKNLIVGDVFELPYKNDEFEMVVALEVVEHIPEDDGQLDQAIREMIRVCNGYIVISTPVGDDDENPRQLEGDLSHFSVHTPEWWTTKFEKLGAMTFYEIVSKESKTFAASFEVKK
jgi:2-polyprenyl-3-methyl-5-hydroxy-6-metoxy-1,4-benzoquinol methylase